MTAYTTETTDRHKKTMKNILISSLSMLLTLGLTAACGGNETAPSPEANTEAGDLIVSDVAGRCPTPTRIGGFNIQTRFIGESGLSAFGGIVKDSPETREKIQIEIAPSPAVISKH